MMQYSYLNNEDANVFTFHLPARNFTGGDLAFTALVTLFTSIMFMWASEQVRNVYYSFKNWVCDVADDLHQLTHQTAAIADGVSLGAETLASMNSNLHSMCSSMRDRNWSDRLDRQRNNGNASTQGIVSLCWYYLGMLSPSITDICLKWLYPETPYMSSGPNANRSSPTMGSCTTLPNNFDAGCPIPSVFEAFNPKPETSKVPKAPAKPMNDLFSSLMTPEVLNAVTKLMMSPSPTSKTSTEPQKSIDLQTLFSTFDNKSNLESSDDCEDCETGCVCESECCGDLPCNIKVTVHDVNPVDDATPESNQKGLKSRRNRGRKLEGARPELGVKRNRRQGKGKTQRNNRLRKVNFQPMVNVAQTVSKNCSPCLPVKSLLADFPVGKLPVESLLADFPVGKLPVKSLLADFPVGKLPVRHEMEKVSMPEVPEASENTTHVEFNNNQPSEYMVGEFTKVLNELENKVNRRKLDMIQDYKQ